MAVPELWTLDMRHAYRWILPVISCIPVLVGVVGTCLASAATDEGGSAMALAFFFFPVSFLLALISAGVTRVRRDVWSKADRVIGYAPLCLLVASVLVTVLLVFLGF